MALNREPNLWAMQGSNLTEPEPQVRFDFKGSEPVPGPKFADDMRIATTGMDICNDQGRVVTRHDERVSWDI